MQSIDPADELPSSIGDLAAVARDEGFNMLDRLVDDWRSGANRFQKPGELLLAALEGDCVVGIAGLNHDPWAGPRTARLRRMYVHPEHRRCGVGSHLLASILDAARAHGFAQLRLRTTTPRGAAFFEAAGFAPVEQPEATHGMPLT